MCKEGIDRDRRSVLRTVAVAGAVGGVGTTGCLDNGKETDNETDDREDGGVGGNETGDDEESEMSTSEAVDFPSDADCAVCNMVAANYPDWNAQVAHTDGERAYLCSSGCMVAYKAYPDEFGAADSDIANVWVTGFKTREFIDAREASYALETDPERIDDPMMTNPAPFEDHADAVKYVDEVDYLTEDDIVEYDDLDADTADSYRGQLTPGGEA